MIVSLIIPCYNEEGNIPTLFNAAQQLLESCPEMEIIFVNNGSRDQSSKVFEENHSRLNDERIKILNIVENRGYGNGILAGLELAKGEFIGWTHADLQTDILDIINAYTILKSRNDVILVKGSRIKRPFFDKIFSIGMSLYVYLILHKWVNEINAQPKLFRRTLFELIKGKAPLDFSLDLYFLLNASSYGKIYEFPVDFGERLHGIAKGGSGNLSLKILQVKRSIKFINEYSKREDSRKLGHDPK